MLNTLRMQLYWMRRSLKTWLIIILCVVFSAVMTYMTYALTDMLKDEENRKQFDAAISETEDVGLSIGVQMDPTQIEEFNDETAYKYESLVSNVFNSGIIELMTVIFAVTVAVAEFKNGYVKNLVCAMKKRRYLPVTKAIAVSLFVIVMVIASALSVIVTAMIISAVKDGGFAESGSVSALLKVIGMQSILHIAVSLFCMTVMTVTKSTVISVIFGVCSATNVIGSALSVVDSLIERLFSKEVVLESYIVSTQIMNCSADMDKDFVVKAVIIAVCFAAVAIAGSVVAVGKRDIK